ncbi:MAG: type II toxin-antitoxin system HicB family antitoxin [Armatimonadetes bacterium]|nr:type II toxin-antitoxin system HicB family antitoxin [Anaerolineae bacterium]
MTLMEQQTIKALAYYLALNYPIVLIPDEDGYWFAEIALLPGCMTQGYNRADALEMLDDAKQLWLQMALDDGMTIPEPEPDKTPVFTFSYR